MVGIGDESWRLLFQIFGNAKRSQNEDSFMLKAITEVLLVELGIEARLVYMYIVYIVQSYSNTHLFGVSLMAILPYKLCHIHTHMN